MTLSFHSLLYSVYDFTLLYKGKVGIWKRASESISQKQKVPDLILNTRYRPKDDSVKPPSPPFGFPIPPDQESERIFVTFRIDNSIQKKIITQTLTRDVNKF